MMKKIKKIFFIIIVFSLFYGFINYAPKLNPPNDPVSVVKTMYSNINSKNFKDNRNLFVYMDADIIAYGKKSGIKRENKSTVAKWTDWQYSEKQWQHYVDKVQVENISNSLCTVLVKGHTGTWRVDFNSIFVLTKLNDEWKIVSMTQENQ
ncbi:MAG: hypothetical protein ACFFDN_34135 [Candidatus Hodarchaeota archaeon]